jgi:hypothetical protein
VSDGFWLNIGCVVRWAYNCIFCLVVPKTTKPVSTTSRPTSHSHFTRRPGHVSRGRAFRLKTRRGANMTLNNTKSPYQYVVMSNSCCTHGWFIVRLHKTRAKRKLIDKPCPRFTTTGAFMFSKYLFNNILSLLIHVYLLLLFYFRSVPMLRTNLFIPRCLRARINVCLSTRSVEDRGLLELPTG